MMPRSTRTSQTLERCAGGVGADDRQLHDSAKQCLSVGRGQRGTIQGWDTCHFLKLP